MQFDFIYIENVIFKLMLNKEKEDLCKKIFAYIYCNNSWLQFQGFNIIHCLNRDNDSHKISYNCWWENASLRGKDNVATFFNLNELSRWIKLSFSECKLSCKPYNLPFKRI